MTAIARNASDTHRCPATGGLPRCFLRQSATPNMTIRHRPVLISSIVLALACLCAPGAHAIAGGGPGPPVHTPSDLELEVKLEKALPCDCEPDHYEQEGGPTAGFITDYPYEDPELRGLVGYRVPPMDSRR